MSDDLFSQPSAPITFYIDVVPGMVADLEVVARASIAFVDAIKELAYVVDPTMAVRVELSSGTQGSLKLNSLIRAVRATGHAYPRITAVSLGALGWFGAEVADYAFDAVADRVTGKDTQAAASTMSGKEQAELAMLMDRARDPAIAKTQRQRIYAELMRDPAIIGVGATLAPDRRPPIVIPRDEFSVRSGQNEVLEHEIARRTETRAYDVVLISPMLIEGVRRWKFNGPFGEFGASMLDETFAREVIRGTTKIRIKGGLHMTVELATTRELSAGVWLVVKHEVIRVLDITEPPSQRSMLPYLSDDEDSER